MPHVVVLGAGVAGLGAALHLRAVAPQVELTVLEGTDRPGGLVRTEHVDGFVIERGPESILSDKPAAMRVARALGIDDQIIGTEPSRRGAYVVAHGKLERIPEGFSLIAPLDLRAFMATPYISLPGKLRALADLALPSRAAGDESLESFVVRRFGPELLVRLAQPLVSGIYGASPASLGLAATMPRFLEAERTSGSVIRGLRKSAGDKAASGARYSLFVNFRRGMQTLPDAMAAALGESVLYDSEVLGLERLGSGYGVRLGKGTTVRADAVVVALGGPRTARLVRPLDDRVSSKLAAVRHGSGAIVTLAYARDQIGHPLDAYGYVTPSIEGRRVIASTFLSRKWPGRAPEGMELLRFFFGRDGDDGVVSLGDDELVRLARFDALSLLDTRGEPALVRVDRWSRAMPRYGVGHLDDVEALERRLVAHPGLALAGNAYRGVGLPDAIASGERAAEKVLADLRIPLGNAGGARS